MRDLSALCVDLGFSQARTYIQSGNVVFKSGLSKAQVQARLEGRLAERLGKKIDVMVRSAAELRAVLEANPFPQAQPARVAVIFLSRRPPKGMMDNLAAPGGEEVKLGKQEIYVYYPDGMGHSKLKLPTTGGAGTARNINTVAKLVALAESVP